MVSIEHTGFDWDEGNREKCQKHGLTLAEIEQFFAGENLYIAPDIKHSQSEQRFLAIGMGQGDRPMFVAFALRMQKGSNRIRPISARYMHKKEWEKYEQKITRNQN